MTNRQHRGRAFQWLCAGIGISVVFMLAMWTGAVVPDHESEACLWFYILTQGIVGGMWTFHGVYGWLREEKSEDQNAD